VLGLLVDGQPPAQASWLLAWLLAVLAVGASRTGLLLGRSVARRRGLIGRPVLILGAGVVGAQVARYLERHPDYGLWPVGFLDDHPRAPEELGISGVPVVGRVADVGEIVASTGVRDLIVAFSSVADARLSGLIGSCQAVGVDVSVVPRMFDAINSRVIYDSVGGVPLLCFQTVGPRGGRIALKARLRARLWSEAYAPTMAGDLSRSRAALAREHPRR
jgi:FlaA1/EpsC-like NDP-sugar epimerase